MPFIPIPQTAEVAVRILQDGQNLANVWHATYQGEPTSQNMVLLASNTIAWWQANIRPLVPATVQLLEVSVVDQSEIGGVAALLAPSSNNTGTSVSPAMPNATTIAVKKSTGRAGRSYRGRVYHIGLTEAQVDNNRISAATVTALNAAYEALIDSYDAANFQWVVASTYFNNAPRVIGITTPIIGVSTDPVIDSQRRRLPGRGR